MNYVKSVQRLNDCELKQGISGGKASWHEEYRHSAYVYVGGLDKALTEGDLIAIFSQYGEIIDLNLIREKKEGHSRGFGFIAYEDQRSTDLAVDNFNGIKILGRTISVNHVDEYKPPNAKEEEEKFVGKIGQRVEKNKKKNKKKHKKV